MISITSNNALEDTTYLVSRAFDSYAFVRWYWAEGKCEAMLERYAARTNQRLRPARPSVVLTDTEKTRKRTRYCFRNLVLILKRRRSDYDTASVRPFGRRKRKRVRLLGDNAGSTGLYRGQYQGARGRGKRHGQMWNTRKLIMPESEVRQGAFYQGLRFTYFWSTCGGPER